MGLKQPIQMILHVSHLQHPLFGSFWRLLCTAVIRPADQIHCSDAEDIPGQPMVLKSWIYFVHIFNGFHLRLPWSNLALNKTKQSPKKNLMWSISPHQFVSGGRNRVSLSMATTLGSNKSPSQNTFESMIFLFPFGGICDRSLEGIFVTLGRVGGLYPPGVTPFQKMFQVLV